MTVGDVQNVFTTTMASYPVMQTASPTTGQTVVCQATASDIMLYLTPAGTLATLTISLPAEGSSSLGQKVFICSRQTITALTVNGATTVLNAADTLIANETFTMAKVAANTWVRLQ